MYPRLRFWFIMKRSALFCTTRMEAIMKPSRSVCLAVVLIAAVWVTACRHGQHTYEAGDLKGQVVDPNGLSLSGVRVVANGALPVMTNARGEFRLARVAPGPRTVVSVSAPGFVSSTRVFQAATRRGKNVIVIWPRAASVTVDAAVGGQVSFATDGSVTLPANALVDQEGRPISGPVGVSVTYFDVSDPAQIRAVPGDFRARMRNGSERRLESFGVFEIFVADRSGRRAELAPDQVVGVKIPIPRAFLDRAPARTGSFSFDPETGYWIEEGVLIRDGLVYTGKIDRFDWSWNADDPLDTTCMTFKVVRPWDNNLPEPSCLVEATGVTYGSMSWGYTDSQGLVCLLVKL